MFRYEALTRIVVFPAGNIAGFLLLFLALLPLFVAFVIFGVHLDRARWLGALLPFTVIASVLVDLRIRSRQRAELGALARWLSPYEGGCFGLIPSWLVGLAMIGAFCAGLTAVFIQRMG